MENRKGILKRNINFNILCLQKQNTMVEIIEVHPDKYYIELLDGFRLFVDKDFVEVVLPLKDQMN